MIRTGWLPTLIALSIYILLGTFSQVENPSTNTSEIFSKYFVLKWYLLLPAISILLLALFRLNVKINMIVSIVISTIIYFIDYPIETNLVNKFIQTFKIMILGFQAPAEISSMMSGGGMIVMAKLILVVLISFTYIGFLKELGILQKIQILILRFAQKISPFGCTTLTACITSALACNQTLSIVLTNEICSKIIPNPKIRAIALENTSVIIAPLIPWTVASLVPLETIGAPTSSIIFASLLYLIPITQWLVNKKATDHKDRSNKK